jgi:hypothetical protein
MMMRLGVLLGGLFAALAWAATAAAQSSAEQSHGSVVAQEQGRVSAGSSVGLPFTALDLVLLVGTAAVLFAIGLAWRRFAWRRG